MNSMNSKNRRMVCEYMDTAERVQCFLFAHFDCLGLTKYMKAHELLTDSLLQLPEGFTILVACSPCISQPAPP